MEKDLLEEFILTSQLDWIGSIISSLPISVMTDEFGNLVTATPGLIK